MNNRNKPLITIIGNFYNGSEFAPQCIESIINQTYKKIEIILVDDKSSDDTADIIRYYAEQDKRIIPIIHKENMGVSLSRNEALDIANGEYICFIDGDDIFLPTYVEYMLGLIIKGKAEVAYTPRAIEFYNKIPEIAPLTEDKIEVQSGEEATESILLYKMMIGPWNKIYSRKLIEKHKLRFPVGIFAGEGFYFNTSIFQRAQKVAKGNAIVYLYRRDNPHSGTTKFSEHVNISTLTALRKIKEDFYLTSTRLDKAWEYANWHSNADVYVRIRTAHAESDYPEMYSKVLKVVRTKGWIALKVPIKKTVKLKAVIRTIFPPLYPSVVSFGKKHPKIIQFLDLIQGLEDY